MIYDMLKTVAVILYVLAAILWLLGLFNVLDDYEHQRTMLISGGVGSGITALFLHALSQLGKDLQKNNNYLHIQIYGVGEDEADDEEWEEDDEYDEDDDGDSAGDGEDVDDDDGESGDPGTVEVDTL